MVQNLEKEEIKIHADRLQQDQNISVLFLFTPICHYYPYHAKKHDASAMSLPSSPALSFLSTGSQT